MRVSILIRTHNNQKTIAQALEGVRAQLFTDYEIILVDSGSTDRTREIIKKYPHTFVDNSRQRFGYGASLNAGISLAKGEYVVCLSSHCIPLHERWLTRLIEALDSDETLAGAWGPLVFERRDGAKVREWVEVVDLEAFYRQPNRGLQNSNSIVRRSLWEEHPFSEEVERCEDQEWAHHFLKQGYRTALVGGAAALYEVPRGPWRYGAKMMRDSIAMREMFGRAPEVSTRDLLRNSARLIGAAALGRRSPRVSAALICGVAGTWLAGKTRRKR